MNEVYLERPANPDTIDLRPLADDRTLLKNPHKGWYIHYIDNGIVRPAYRDTIKDGDYLEDLPLINHLYLRVDWSDIEPEEGKFDWSYLDRIFDEWGSRGYRFSFRFCTYETPNPHATPEWVRLAGAKGTFVDPPETRPELRHWEPDYGDPVYLAKLELFIAACAEKYDGHPLVEFVDIGTFGTWGEGHTFAGTGKRYSADVLRIHADLHAKYFRNTFLLVNDDFCHTAYLGGESSFGRDGSESALRLTDYLAARGMGARDDSICVAGYAKTYGYDTLRNGPFFDKFYKTAPVDIELEHFAAIADDVILDCFPFMEALKRSHATYAGFHGDPRVWYDRYRPFTEYMGNRLGYWYFLNRLDLPKCVSGLKTLAHLEVENRGLAPAYNPYMLKLRVRSDDCRREIFSADGLNLGWDGKKEELLRLDFADVAPGKYQLELGLFEGELPIKLALKPELCDGGWYKLTELYVE